MLRSLLGIALITVARAQGPVAELVHPHGEAGDGFGAAVAIGPRHVLVGAPWDGPQERGRAYLYDRATGAHLKSYVPSDWEAGDNLGIAVAVGDEVAAIAAYSSDLGINSGSVYVYDLTTGQLRFELHAPNGKAADLFGRGLALGPGYLAVSAPGDDHGESNAGAVFIYALDSGDLLQELRTAAPRPNARLGNYLAVDGHFVVASSNWDAGPVENVGAVFVFDILLGVQRHRLLAWDRAEDDRFGTALATQGGRVLIGASGYDRSGIEDVGKAYVHDLNTGEHLFDVNAPFDATEGDRFGTSVAFGDGVLVVGAPASDSHVENGGQVYVYDAGGDLLDAFGEPSPGDRFGQYIQADRSRLVVAAPQADPHGDKSGAAYLFCLHRPLGETFCGPANLNSTGLPAKVGSRGALEVGCGDFEVGGHQLPPEVPCVALVSAGEDFAAMVWGGNGNLCLAKPLGAFLGGMTPATAAGRVALPLDLLRPLPKPLGNTVRAGETWRFQVWYRDWQSGPTSNLTEGLRVTFE